MVRAGKGDTYGGNVEIERWIFIGRHGLVRVPNSFRRNASSSIREDLPNKPIQTSVVIPHNHIEKIQSKVSRLTY